MNPVPILHIRTFVLVKDLPLEVTIQGERFEFVTELDRSSNVWRFFARNLTQ